MKKIVALVLSIILLATVFLNRGFFYKETVVKNNTEVDSKKSIEIEEKHGLEDDIYANLSEGLSSDEYIIEDINTQMVSKEYLEELEYGLKENVYFGYTESELEDRFDGKEYIFTSNEEGETTVREVKDSNNTYKEAIIDVAWGGSIILAEVAIMVIGAKMGVNMVVAMAVKEATKCAVIGSTIGSISLGIIRQLETGDIDETLKSAAKGFKWGAIGGTFIGSTSGLIKANKIIPNFLESQVRALKKFGGKEQVAFLKGKQVSYTMKNTTRPDIVRYKDGVLEAIEVKNYNLLDEANRKSMYREIVRQVSDRVKNLPKGSTQRIVLDVKGRGYSKKFLKNIIEDIKNACSSCYKDIPVEYMYW